MMQDRILDAVWSMCHELAEREGRRRSSTRRWDGSRVLREAAGCVLASQVSHGMAIAAVRRLTHERLLPPTRHTSLVSRIAAVLGSPLTAEFPRAYRFPNLAARRLSRLFSVSDELLHIVTEELSLRCARKRLMLLRCGLGPKQASLLLRNVRIDGQLAVLDVHLVAFMRVIGLTDLLKVPAGITMYEELEDRFLSYAKGLRMPVERLDKAAWIVMRTVRGEERPWPS